MAVALVSPPHEGQTKTTTPFIVRRAGGGAYNGRGGYGKASTDDSDVAAYCGTVRSVKQSTDALGITGSTEGIVADSAIVFDVPGMNIKSKDQLLEAVDDGTDTGHVVPKSKGRVFDVHKPLFYERTTQVQVKLVE